MLFRSIMLDDELTQIQGVASREEEVRFKTPILLKDFPRINDWLTKLESEMRVSLAELLCGAVAELQTFYSTGETLNQNQFITWIEKFPAQLVTLAVQVAWTASIESSFQETQSLDGPLDTIRQGLDLLADVVLTELTPVTRRKCEHLTTELIHQPVLSFSNRFLTTRPSLGYTKCDSTLIQVSTTLLTV